MGSIAAITLLARIVGFGRWFAFSHSVGATCVGTVYQSVNAVPNVLYEVAAGGVLSAVAVPLLASSLARGDRRQADETASALLTWAILVLVPLAVAVTVAARPIAGVLLGTGCAGDRELGAQLLRMFAPQIPLYGVGIVLAGVLQSHRRFIAAAVTPLLSSVVVIVAYLAYDALVVPRGGAVGDASAAARVVLGVGTTVGVVALSLPMILPVIRTGTRLRPRLTFPSGLGPRVRTLALAGLLAVAGQQVSALAMIRLANDRGGTGTINVFTYVQAVGLLPYAVLAVPLATAAFPSLAGAAALEPPRDGSDRSASVAATTLRTSWFATVAAGLIGSALVVATATPVARFFGLLDAGSSQGANGEPLRAMDTALLAFAPAVLALAAMGILSRAAYVRGHPLAAGGVVAAGWLGTTVAPLLLLDPGEADGSRAVWVMALGTTTGLVVAAIALGWLVRRGWGAASLSLPVRPLAAVAAGSVVGAGAGHLAGGLDGGRSLVTWAALSVLAAAVSLALAATVAHLVDPSLKSRLVAVRHARD